MQDDRHTLIRSLFERYIEMYASRDDQLTALFSENFVGYTGGGAFLVNNKQVWVDITRQDFAQVPKPIKIELLDLQLQDLSKEVVVATGLFHIRLPSPDADMKREWVRLTLIFMLEDESWRIAYSGISIPDQLVNDGEVYPIKGLLEQNEVLKQQLEERTRALETANEKLMRLMPFQDKVRLCLETQLHAGGDIATVARIMNLSTRTLVRHLRAEDTTFLKVKDYLRRDITLRLLRQGQPVSEIAAQVGFESLTGFYRAFKAWTGMTPLTFRRQGDRRKAAPRD